MKLVAREKQLAKSNLLGDSTMNRKVMSRGASAKSKIKSWSEIKTSRKCKKNMI